jgi:hypothetical protein
MYYTKLYTFLLSCHLETFLKSWTQHAWLSPIPQVGTGPELAKVIWSTTPWGQIIVQKWAYARVIPHYVPGPGGGGGGGVSID